MDVRFDAVSSKLTPVTHFISGSLFVGRKLEFLLPLSESVKSSRRRPRFRHWDVMPNKRPADNISGLLLLDLFTPQRPRFVLATPKTVPVCIEKTV
jgi:hypothetical protein